MSRTENATAAALEPVRSILAGKVLTHCLFSLSPPEVAAHRKLTSWSTERKTGSPTTLRYADEQTVAATHAVLAGMKTLGGTPEPFRDWGVIAATRFLGRAGLAKAVQIFDKEGVWGVSPHLIPHYALHSASGTLSLTLGIHGPNLGVGGGVHAAVEGFLTALTWLAAGIVPGVWLVMTGWAPEFVPADAESPASPADCHALALALVASDGSHEFAGSGAGLTVCVAALGQVPPPDAPLDLPALAQVLAGPEQVGSSLWIACDPAGSYGVRLSRGHESAG